MFILHKSSLFELFFELEQLVDEVVTIQFKNICNLPYIFASYYPVSAIGHHFWKNFNIKKLYIQQIVPIIIKIYFISF